MANEGFTGNPKPKKNVVFPGGHWHPGAQGRRGGKHPRFHTLVVEANPWISLCKKARICRARRFSCLAAKLGGKNTLSGKRVKDHNDDPLQKEE